MGPGVVAGQGRGGGQVAAGQGRAQGEQGRQGVHPRAGAAATGRLRSEGSTGWRPLDGLKIRKKKVNVLLPRPWAWPAGPGREAKGMKEG